jgi:hypothetical protein
MNNSTNNTNNNLNGNNELLKRKKEPPTKPPPPTLPKPKFILPQNTATSLVLQRNLKAKSELNIATPLTYLSSSSSSSSSGASSTSSSKDVLNTNSPDQLAKQSIATPSHLLTIQSQQPSNMINTQNFSNNKLSIARNKLLENNSLVSSSQGYHSDTWDSHSSRQSFDMDHATSNENSSSQNVAPARFKHFNKLSKLAADAKIAKIPNILPINNINKNIETNGSTSDGSNGVCSGDDTDHSIPINVYSKNIITHDKTSSSASTVSNSSNSCSSSTTSSAAAISGAATLSSNSANSFSAAVTATVNITDNQNLISINNKETMKKHSNGAIELPIYYQTTNKNEEEQNKNSNRDKTNNSQSISQNNLQSDLYDFFFKFFLHDN